MAETPRATGDASPSPFRRFPWVQLVFCIACLTMTVWTWMRYSYAWEVAPSDLGGCDAAWVDRYVELEGSLAEGDHEVMAHIEGRDGDLGTLVMLGEGNILAGGGTVSVKGRVIDASFSFSPELGKPIALKMLGVNNTLSRFTGASVAGIVVGAMGCFIFGLYLRAWLGERKAA